MYRLFLALYTRKDAPPTQAEVDLARGDVPADGEAAKAYLGKVETATASILKGLERQAKKAQVLDLFHAFAAVHSSVFRETLNKRFSTLSSQNGLWPVISRLTKSRSLSSSGSWSILITGRLSTSRYPAAPPFAIAS